MIFKTKTKQYCWLYHFGRGKDHIVAILGTSTNQKKRPIFWPKKISKISSYKTRRKKSPQLGGRNANSTNRWICQDFPKNESGDFTSFRLGTERANLMLGFTSRAPGCWRLVANLKVSVDWYSGISQSWCRQGDTPLFDSPLEHLGNAILQENASNPQFEVSIETLPVKVLQQESFEN